MEGDTPIGSLVVPYTPRAAPVPALPVFGFVALGAGLAAAGLVRLRRNVRR